MAVHLSRVRQSRSSSTSTRWKKAKPSPARTAAADLEIVSLEPLELAASRRLRLRRPEDPFRVNNEEDEDG